VFAAMEFSRCARARARPTRDTPPLPGDPRQIHACNPNDRAGLSKLNSVRSFVRRGRRSSRRSD